MDTKARYYPYIAFGIICLGTGLRLIGLDKALWYDECAALEIARSGNFVQALQMRDYPPTYFFLLRLWSSFNASEPFLRLLSVFWGVLTMVVIMAWVRSFSLSASLLTGFLVATTPILLRYSQEVQAYPLLLFSVACSFYCAHRISSDSAAIFWYCCLAAALCVAVTTHMVGIMLLPSICIYLLPTLWKQRHIFPWTKLIVAVLIPVVVFGVTYLFFTVEGKAEGWWMPPLSIDLVIAQFTPVLGIDSLRALIAALGGYHSILAAPYMFMVTTCMALCLGCLMFLGDWRRTWMLLAAAGIIWLEIALFSLVFLPIFHDRTIMPGLIPLLAFAGVQATTIRRKAIAFIAVTSLGLLGLLSTAGWLATDARNPREGWREVGQYLESEYQPGNLVAFYPSYIEGPTTYYFPALRNDDVIPIAKDTSIQAVDYELTKHISLSKGKASPVSLFLIVRRSDALSQANNVTYSSVLAYLESAAIYVYPQRSFKNVLVLQYELRR